MDAQIADVAQDLIAQGIYLYANVSVTNTVYQPWKSKQIKSMTDSSRTKQDGIV